MDSSQDAGILMEFIEVVIFTILYFRNLYPKTIFKRKKLYNSPVFAPMYPDLINYVKKVLETAKELKEDAGLNGLNLIIYDATTNTDIESYSLELLKSPSKRIKADPYFIDLEDEYRHILLSLNSKLGSITPLPNGNKSFRIQLQTKETDYIKITGDPRFDNFPWIKAPNNCERDSEKANSELMPIAYGKLTGIQIIGNKLGEEM